MATTIRLHWYNNIIVSAMTSHTHYNIVCPTIAFNIVCPTIAFSKSREDQVTGGHISFFLCANEQTT